MPVKFASTTKQGAVEFIPGVSLAFEDPDAEPFFIAAGWAEATDEAPLRTYTQDEVSIDPLTRSASDGKFVLPDHPAAVEAQAEIDPQPGVDVHDLQEG